GVEAGRRPTRDACVVIVSVRVTLEPLAPTCLEARGRHGFAHVLLPSQPAYGEQAASLPGTMTKGTLSKDAAFPLLAILPAASTCRHSSIDVHEFRRGSLHAVVRAGQLLCVAGQMLP